MVRESVAVGIERESVAMLEVRVKRGCPTAFSVQGEKPF
jgi:hypothetical protein